ncbi:hypothetical protein GW891_01150, partial [bacterium]|nr:hypothetical protein [bacterium]
PEILSVSQFKGSFIHLSIAVVLIALPVANSFTTQNVSFVIVDIVLQKTGTYQVAYSSHSQRRILHFKTSTFQESSFHSFHKISILSSLP